MSTRGKIKMNGVSVKNDSLKLKEISVEKIVDWANSKFLISNEQHRIAIVLSGAIDAGDETGKLVTQKLMEIGDIVLNQPHFQNTISKIANTGKKEIHIQGMHTIAIMSALYYQQYFVENVNQQMGGYTRGFDTFYIFKE